MFKNFAILFVCSFSASAFATDIMDIVVEARSLLFQKVLLGPDGDQIEFDSILPLEPGYRGAAFEAERTLASQEYHSIGITFYEEDGKNYAELRVGRDSHGLFSANLVPSGGFEIVRTDLSQPIHAAVCRERNQKTQCVIFSKGQQIDYGER